jgi:hypothetical protein
LLLDVDPGLSQAMRQRILVNFLQMAVAMITMNSERGFSHEITQFVNVVYSGGFHFLRFLRLFAAIPYVQLFEVGVGSGMRRECSPDRSIPRQCD